MVGDEDAVIEEKWATLPPISVVNMMQSDINKLAIIGGGFSGVEVAGEINDYLKSAARYHKNLRLKIVWLAFSKI